MTAPLQREEANWTLLLQSSAKQGKRCCCHRDQKTKGQRPSALSGLTDALCTRLQKSLCLRLCDNLLY